VVLSLLVICLLPGKGTTNAGGALADKIIYGYVFDFGGQPVSGAEVLVEIWGGYWPYPESFRISQETVADSSGYYEVLIDANYWDPHNTIWVFAASGPYEEDVKAEADAEPDQRVDVALAQVIPEFSSPMAIVSVCVLLALVFCRGAARNRDGP